MAQALRVKNNIYRLNVDDPVQPSEEHVQRIFANNVLGMVVNLEQVHWVAVRVVHNRIWLLDSCQVPVLHTLHAMAEYVREHRHAFLVELSDR